MVHELQRQAYLSALGIENYMRGVVIDNNQKFKTELQKEISAFTEVHSLEFDVRNKEEVLEKIKKLFNFFR